MPELPSPGFDISLRDFVEILGESDERISGPLRQRIKDWFGHSVTGYGPDTRIESSAGQSIDAAALHRQIENDGEQQLVVYRMAMAFWHFG